MTSLSVSEEMRDYEAVPTHAGYTPGYFTGFGAILNS